MNASIAVSVNNSSSLRWHLEYPQTRPERDVTPAIRVGGRVPAWAIEVRDRIEELAMLPHVHPSGSRPLDVYDVFDALEFLKRVMREDTAPPWIGRLSSGGLQLTWRAPEMEVEAVFDRARDERQLIVVVGETEWDAPIDSADSLFATVSDRLARSHIEYPAAA